MWETKRKKINKEATNFFYTGFDIAFFPNSIIQFNFKIILRINFFFLFSNFINFLSVYSILRWLPSSGIITPVKWVKETKEELRGKKEMGWKREEKKNEKENFSDVFFTDFNLPILFIAQSRGNFCGTVPMWLVICNFVSCLSYIFWYGLQQNVMAFLLRYGFFFFALDV